MTELKTLKDMTIKHTNTMKKGESYTLDVVRVDHLKQNMINWIKWLRSPQSGEHIETELEVETLVGWIMEVCNLTEEDLK